MTSDHNSQEISAVFFDLDGTLVDTEFLGVTALDALLNRLEISLNDFQREEFTNAWLISGSWLPVELELKKIYKSIIIPLSLEVFIREFFDEYQHQITSAQVLPGMTQALHTWSAQFLIGLVTGSGRRQAEKIIHQNKWDKIFSVIVTQDDVKNGKPSSEPYLLAARLLNVSPRNSLAVENSPIGIRSAKDAGMFTIGIHAGNIVRHNLSHADIEVESGDQLLEESLSFYGFANDNSGSKLY